MKNVALLVFACDRYKLLYQGFDYFFNKNWDKSFALKTYFSTEETDTNLDNFTQLKSRTGEWTNRLKCILNQIPEDYIVFFQEDMWLEKPMQPGVLKKIILHAIENDLKLVKLHSSEVYKTKPTNINFEGFLLAEVLKEDSDFLMSHQVSLWNKQFLIEQLLDNEHPWRNERKGSKRLKKTKETIYQVDLLSENGKNPINQNRNNVTYGGYKTISANACLQQNASPFIKIIKDEHPDYAEQLLFNLTHEITHDGLPKPRKIDLVKKIKTWLLAKP